MIPDNIAIVRTFPGEDIRIHAIADLHIGSAEWMEKEWDVYKRRILDDPNAYITVGGDMINNGIKSSLTNVYEETMRPREQKARLLEELTPLRDRILCGVSGNHEARSGKEVDQNPLYDVFCKLDIEDRYRENGAFMVLRFGDKKGDSRSNPTYMGACFHGAGGGMYIGSGFNKLERFGAVLDGLDFIISSHIHKPGTIPVEKLVFDSRNGRITQKQFRVLVATSWLRYGGYGMKKMMQPTAHCPGRLHLWGDRKLMEVTM